MALVRKYQDEVVSTESSQDVQAKQQDKVVFSGSSLFTPSFKGELAKQQKFVEEAYAKKVEGITNSQILTNLSSVYDSTENTFARLNEFIKEISKCEYSDDIVTIKITKSASVYLKFAQASSKIESFSFVEQSSDIGSVSDLFSQIEKNSEFSCDSVISVAKNVFVQMRYKCFSILKKFSTGWIKQLDQLVVEVKSNDSTSVKSAKTQVKQKRTSTTIPRKPKKEKPPQERFIGVLVGYSVNEESQIATFKVLRFDNKSVVEMFDNLNNRLYYKVLHNIAKFSNDGTIIPVVCYNWYKDISSNLCIKDYYPQDEYADFEEQYNIKVSALKAAYDEYTNS